MIDIRDLKLGQKVVVNYKEQHLFYSQEYQDVAVIIAVRRKYFFIRICNGSGKAYKIDLSGNCAGGWNSSMTVTIPTPELLQSTEIMSERNSMLRKLYEYTGWNNLDTEDLRRIVRTIENNNNACTT